MQRWLAVILVFLLLFSLTGCASGEKVDSGPQDTGQTDGQTAPGTGTDTPVEAPSGDGAEPDDDAGPLIEGEFYRLDEIKDIIAAFSELEYTFEDGATGSGLSVSYTLQGQETVGGTVTDHIIISYASDGETVESELWIDEDGNPRKSKMDGMELGEAESSFVVMSMMGMLMPFTMYASGWEDAFIQEKGYEHLGWRVTQQSSGTRNLGAGDVKVQEIKFVGKDFATNQDLNFSYEIAQIGNQAMFIGWETEVGPGNKVTYRVTRLIPR